MIETDTLIPPFPHRSINPPTCGKRVTAHPSIPASPRSQKPSRARIELLPDAAAQLKISPMPPLLHLRSTGHSRDSPGWAVAFWLCLCSHVAHAGCVGLKGLKGELRLRWAAGWCRRKRDGVCDAAGEIGRAGLSSREGGVV